MGPALLPTPLLPARGLCVPPALRQVFRGALGARCIPVSGVPLAGSALSGSLTGARTGIRFLRFARSSGDLPRVRPVPQPFFPWWPPSSFGLASAETPPSPYSDRDRKSRPNSGVAFAGPSNGPLASGRSLRHAFLRICADRCRCTDRLGKLLGFQAFRPWSGEPFRALSMIRECASAVSRTTVTRPSFPLPAELAVDGGG